MSYYIFFLSFFMENLTVTIKSKNFIISISRKSLLLVLCILSASKMKKLNIS